MAPLIQIYTAQSVDEALAMVEIGVDRIGVTPAERGLPGEISAELAAEIVGAVGAAAAMCALTVESDPRAIEEMVRAVRPRVLHLSGPSGAMAPEAVAQLRERLPSIELMQAVGVLDESAIAEAAALAPVVDVILLDSVTPDVEGIGAAGVVHDWEVSRRIVEAVHVPVVLAGGLSPENVAEAVSTVRPWAVDSLTHTNQPLDGGGFRKDLDLVAAFVDAARGAV